MANPQQALAQRAQEVQVQDPEESEFRTPLTDGAGIDALTRAEIDVQIRTARAYPRSIKRAKLRAQEMATLDEATAQSCFYALDRGGKIIEGPSIRLAEIFASAWGNIRHGARVVDEGDRFITAEGRCLDLETNNGSSVEVVRRITDKTGKKYKDDMIQVTAMAAQKIAQRNAIFSVIPRAYVNEVMAKAKAVAVGDIQTLATKREGWVEWFKKAGVTTERILARLGRAGIEDITLEDIGILIGFHTSLKENAATVDQLFPPVAQATDASGAPATRGAAAADAAAKAAERVRQKTAPAKDPQPKDADKRVADKSGAPAADGGSDGGGAGSGDGNPRESTAAEQAEFNAGFRKK